MLGRGAADGRGGPGPTEEQVGVVLPGEADPAGHLDVGIGGCGERISRLGACQ